MESSSSRDITKYQHAPEKLGFTHTRETRFTYFSGSKAGVRTSFGLTCEEFTRLIETFSVEFMRNSETYGRQLTS